MKKLRNIEAELEKSVAKLMTKFLNKFKKNYFDPFLDILWAIFLSKTPALSPTTSSEFLTPIQNLTKNNDPIPKKFRRDGQDNQIDRNLKGPSSYHRESK